jgi:hypothetical protein
MPIYFVAATPPFAGNRAKVTNKICWDYSSSSGNRAQNANNFRCIYSSSRQITNQVNFIILFWGPKYILSMYRLFFKQALQQNEH